LKFQTRPIGKNNSSGKNNGKCLLLEHLGMVQKRYGIYADTRHDIALPSLGIPTVKRAHLQCNFVGETIVEYIMGF
jgi:hypothetical protein